MAKLSPTDVVLHYCVLSYPRLWEPHQFRPDEQPKYGCALLLHPSLEGQWRPALEAAYDAAYAASKFAQRAHRSQMGPSFQVGLKQVEPDKVPPIYHGRWMLQPKRRADLGPPKVLDLQYQPLDRSLVFPGCIVHAHLNIFAYEAGNAGLGVGLNHIQVYQNQGVVRLDNALSPEEVFGGIAGAPPPPDIGAPAVGPVLPPGAAPAGPVTPGPAYAPAGPVTPGPAAPPAQQPYQAPQAPAQAPAAPPGAYPPATWAS